MMSENESDSELHVAVRYGELADCHSALLDGCDPNQIGLYKWTPFQEAASEGNAEVIKLMVSYGGKPEMPDKLLGDTALHHAVKSDHPATLKILLNAMTKEGQNQRLIYALSLSNDEGNTILSLASRNCWNIIEKFRVEAFMRLNPLAAQDEAARANHTSSKPSQISGLAVSAKERAASPDSGVGSLILRESKHRENADGSNQPLTGSLGRLVLSFEYNSKRCYLKIRLWKLVGLLLAPAFSSSIKSFYVKSYLKPDENKISRRKSDEVKVAPLLEAILSKPPQQPYVTDTGKEELFHPVEMKFSQPLVYEGVDPDSISYKTLLIQVCARQKFSMKSFVISDMTIPLRVAVSKIVRESFPLLPNKESKLPTHMTILANDQPSTGIVGSDPNLKNYRSGSSLSISSSTRPASDVDLRTTIQTSASMSSHSPQVSIDMGSDIEETNMDTPLQRKTQPINKTASKQHSSNPTKDSHVHVDLTSSSKRHVNNQEKKVIGSIELHKLPECQVVVHSTAELTKRQGDISKTIEYNNTNMVCIDINKPEVSLRGNVLDKREEFELKCLSTSISPHQSIDIETLEQYRTTPDVILTMTQDSTSHTSISKTDGFGGLPFKGKSSCRNALVNRLVETDDSSLPSSVVLPMPEYSTELAQNSVQSNRSEGSEGSELVKISLGDLELEDVEEFQHIGSKTSTKSQTSLV